MTAQGENFTRDGCDVLDEVGRSPTTSQPGCRRSLFFHCCVFVLWMSATPSNENKHNVVIMSKCHKARAPCVVLSLACVRRKLVASYPVYDSQAVAGPRVEGV